MEPIVNRVAESDIEVLDLEKLWDGRPVRDLDLAEFLEDGLVLRERDFRTAVKEYDWRSLADTHVAITCSTDAIVPTWAYMLIASRLEGIAASVAAGNQAVLVGEEFSRRLERMDWEQYRDAIVVLKGCGSASVPDTAYLVATQKLMHVARKIMYGEPCSSVPIWRRPAGPAPSSSRSSGPASPPQRPAN